jgi:hypothetical protein
VNDWFKIHGKSLPLILGALFVALRQVTDDGAVTGAEWFVVIGAANSAVAVYFVANLTGTAGKYGKIITHTVTLTIPALVAFLPGGVNGNELIDLLIVAGTAAGVLIFPSVQHPVNPVVLGPAVAKGAHAG